MKRALGVCGLLGILATAACGGAWLPQERASARADREATEARGVDTAVGSRGEWVSGPIDLRKTVGVVRATPHPQIQRQLSTLANAMSDDPEWQQTLRAEASGGFGSGFVMVRSDGRKTSSFIVTNRHVVETASVVEVEFDGQRPRDADVVFTHPKFDVAVLQVREGDAPMAYGLRPREADVRERQTVVAAGFPGIGGRPSFQITEGKISNAAYQDGAKLHFFQHTAAIDPGSSGGPLTDEQGRLVGINTAIVGGRSLVGFAVPVTAVEESVRLASSVTQGRSDAAWLERELVRTCSELGEELASSSPRYASMWSLISNKLVAEEGMPSVLNILAADLDTSTQMREMRKDPLHALKLATFVRFLYASTENGASSSTCTVHSADRRELGELDIVRTRMPFSRGNLEIGWTFEQGHWRIAHAPLHTFPKKAQKPGKK